MSFEKLLIPVELFGPWGDARTQGRKVARRLLKESERPDSQWEFMDLGASDAKIVFTEGVYKLNTFLGGEKGNLFFTPFVVSCMLQMRVNAPEHGGEFRYAWYRKTCDSVMRHIDEFWMPLCLLGSSDTCSILRPQEGRPLHDGHLYIAQKAIEAAPIILRLAEQGRMVEGVVKRFREWRSVMLDLGYFAGRVNAERWRQFRDVESNHEAVAMMRDWLSG